MLRGLALVWLLLLPLSLSARPFVPASDDVVLERLPLATDAGAREVRRLREALARDPERLDLALRLAWRWVELARASSDPRPAGWAEGALAPWLARAEPPNEALLLRATVRQNRHDFPGALEDLDRVLARDPRSAQTWLTRAVILLARGEPHAGERSCRPLLRLADPLAATSCLATAAGLSGRGSVALALLERSLAQHAAAPAALRLWAWASYAELAARLGRDAEAERGFRTGYELSPRDPALLTAFADFLLARGRAREARDLLVGETAAEGLLLRLALAERALGLADADVHAAELRARFAALRARGESLHAGEEARFALSLRGDARAALGLARANFAVQREPRDAEILLEAALAARAPDAAEPALAWLAATNLEDTRLAALAARVEALR